jgi:hypothetical protein
MEAATARTDMETVDWKTKKKKVGQVWALSGNCCREARSILVISCLVCRSHFLGDPSSHKPLYIEYSGVFVTFFSSFEIPTLTLCHT